MSGLVRSSLLRQCVRQVLAKNQRSLSVLSASKFSYDLQPAAVGGQQRCLFELNQIRQQSKRNKSIQTRKILYTREELIEKVMTVSKKHDKIDPAKVNGSFGLNSVAVFECASERAGD